MVTEVTALPLPVVPDDLQRIPLVQNQRSIGWISDRVTAVTEGSAPFLVVGAASFLASRLPRHAGLHADFFYFRLRPASVCGEIWKPVMWGWDIINFVWWIGIGHAGTLISAILFLLRQRWHALASIAPLRR